MRFYICLLVFLVTIGTGYSGEIKCNSFTNKYTDGTTAKTYIPHYHSSDSRKKPYPLAATSPGHPVFSLEKCQRMKDSLNAGWICSSFVYDKNTKEPLFTPYNVTKRSSYHDTIHGKKSFTDCKRALDQMVITGHNAIYCGKPIGKKTVKPFSIHNKQFFSSDQFAYASLDECIMKTSHSNAKGLICLELKDGGFKLYNGLDSDFEGDSLDSLDSCKASLTVDHRLYCYKEGNRYFAKLLYEDKKPVANFSNQIACQFYLSRQAPQEKIERHVPPFSFQKFIEKKHEDKNFKYPRVNYPLYRGAEPQLYSLQNALGAMFGKKDEFIGSILFQGLSLSLQDKLGNSSSDYIRGKLAETAQSKDVSEWLSRPFGHDIPLYTGLTGLIKSKSSWPMDKISAQAWAAKVSDLSFITQSEISEYKLIRRIGHYDDKKYYEDFPLDVVFTSIYQQTAVNYGAGVTIINDQAGKRGLDLTYLNARRDGSWKRGDTGEFIHPGYISPQEITGYHMHRRGNYPDRLKNKVFYKEYSKQRFEPLKLAFYKKMDGASPYVLVFAGNNDRDKRNNLCIRRNPGRTSYRYCVHHDERSFASNSVQEPLLTSRDHPDGKSAKFMGLIVPCQSDGKCKIPSKALYSRYFRALAPNSKLFAVQGHPGHPSNQISSIRTPSGGHLKYIPYTSLGYSTPPPEKEESKNPLERAWRRLTGPFDL